MNDDVTELLAAGTAPLGLRQGTVQATATGPSRVTVRLGAGTKDLPDRRYLAPYVPTVGDTVWVLVAGADLVVLGKLAA